MPSLCHREVSENSEIQKKDIKVAKIHLKFNSILWKSLTVQNSGRIETIISMMTPGWPLDDFRLTHDDSWWPKMTPEQPKWPPEWPQESKIILGWPIGYPVPWTPKYPSIELLHICELIISAILNDFHFKIYVILTAWAEIKVSVDKNKFFTVFPCSKSVMDLNFPE